MNSTSGMVVAFGWMSFGPSPCSQKRLAEPMNVHPAARGEVGERLVGRNPSECRRIAMVQAALYKQ